MKNPLHYQFSEYDCGPTSMQNAISFLFDREEIPPEVLRNIMLYCLDCYSSEGVPGKSGTSCAAMMFLSNWLNSMGNLGILPVKSRYLSGKEVYLGNESYVNDALRRGGAVVLRLFSDEWTMFFLQAKTGNMSTCLIRIMIRKDMVLMTYRLSKIVRRAIIALCRGNILIKLR